MDGLLYERERTLLSISNAIFRAAYADVGVKLFATAARRSEGVAANGALFGLCS